MTFSNIAKPTSDDDDTMDHRIVNVHRTENNTQKVVLKDYAHEHKDKLDDEDDQESGHSMEKLFHDNHTDTSFDDEEDSEDDSINVLPPHQQGKRASFSKRPSLTAPIGLPNIDIKAELANNAKHKTKQDKSQSTAKTKQKDEVHEMDEERKDKYPGALPSIPQTSSVDHNVDTKETSDIIIRHEKKKSLSQMMIQDLELDRKFNTDTRRKSSKKTSKSPNIQSMDSTSRQPLTPLAMLTQIGIDMPDIDNLIEEFQLPTTHNTDHVSSSTVPSPPVLNGGLTRNSRKFTPKMIGSSDFIDIFNEDQENDQFKHPLEMGSRVSINANQFITDINYANNHRLASGINRADSDYRPMINKDIDAILNEMQQPKRDRPPKKALSPVRKSLHKVSYSFDGSNTLYDKTPIIDEETLQFDEEPEEVMEFKDIEETVLIVKQEGVKCINEICDRLVNDDDFYIKEVREIQHSYTEYGDIQAFLNEHGNLTHGSNPSIKAAALLFGEISVNERFAIMPLYRSNAITYLYECCTKYQSLQLLDDEVIVRPRYCDTRAAYVDQEHYHLKKPTDELQALDNVHFDDYDEYPSDDDRKEDAQDTKQSQNITQKTGTSVNERLRELFKTQHVYCPKNTNEYKVIKQVLWPQTNYTLYDDKYEYVDSIAIIKPNALKHYEMIIRATLIGNGFVVTKCKTVQYSAHDDALHRIMHCMDSKLYYEQDPKLQDEAMEYLSSARCGVMVIKKAIGVDTCLNAKQCFNQLSELIGCADPQIDRKNDDNTQSIRGCFGDDLIHNAIDVSLTKKDFRTIYSIVF
eukprot:255268_1